MAGSQKSSPPRLMVIDDEPTVGRRLEHVFGKIGFIIETFTSPAAAMQRLREQPFDVVVTDLKMKGMDGMQVLAQIREHHPQIKVILITGYAQLETAAEAFRQGVFDFITKPFRLNELRQSILRATESLRRDDTPQPSSPQSPSRG